MIKVQSRFEVELSEFLATYHFYVEMIEEGIYVIKREDELPVFLSVKGDTLYFEVDLGNFSEIRSDGLMFKLLDYNTEILPVSFGINNANPDNPRLVLVESRSRVNLQQEDLLSVFDALELATDKAEELLVDYIK